MIRNLFFVESTKDSKPISYPKAGLILRTSSFKDADSSSEHRESSSTQKHVAVKTSTSTRTVTGDTFLTNQNRVTGVQDVITRMKTKGKKLFYFVKHSVGNT